MDWLLAGTWRAGNEDFEEAFEVKMAAHMHLHVVFACLHDCLHTYTQSHAALTVP